MNFFKAMKNMFNVPDSCCYINNYSMYDTDYKKFLDEAYKNPIIYSCFKEIINDFNASEICVYKKIGDKVTKVENHSVQKILENPNPELTQTDFQEYFMTWYLLGGGLLAGKTAGILTKYINLYPVNAFSVERDKLQITKIKIGKESITGRNLDRYKIIRTVNPEDCVAGYGGGVKEFRSPLTSAAIVTDMSNFAFIHQNSQLLNSGKRLGIMLLKKFMSKDKQEEFEKKFKSQGSGTQGAGRVAFINAETADFKSMDLTPQEMDWLNSMVFVREVICSCLGVPVSLISSQNSSYNNLAEFKKKIYQDTIIPMLKMYCNQMTRLLKDELGEDHYIWYDVSEIKALEEDNTDAMEKVVRTLSGLASKNELRKIISDKFGYDLPERKLKGYDELFIQQSMIPIGEAAAIVDIEEGEGEEEEV